MAGPATPFTLRYHDDREHWIPPGVGVVEGSCRGYFGPVPPDVLGELYGSEFEWSNGLLYSEYLAGKVLPPGVCAPVQLSTKPQRVNQGQRVTRPIPSRPAAIAEGQLCIAAEPIRFALARQGQTVTSRFEVDMPPTGTILPFVGLTPPPGYLACDGSEVDIATYPALWDAIAIVTTGTIDFASGTIYDLPADVVGQLTGGTPCYMLDVAGLSQVVSIVTGTSVLTDGAATIAGTREVRFYPFGSADPFASFTLPDLRGRAPMRFGAGTGLTGWRLAHQVGEEAHTMAEHEMPSHRHAISITYRTPQPDAGGNVIDLGGSDGPGHTDYTGSGDPFNVLGPRLAVNYIIKT